MGIEGGTEELVPMAGMDWGEQDIGTGDDQGMPDPIACSSLWSGPCWNCKFISMLGGKPSGPRPSLVVITDSG